MALHTGPLCSPLADFLSQPIGSPPKLGIVLFEPEAPDIKRPEPGRGELKVSREILCGQFGGC